MLFASGAALRGRLRTCKRFRRVRTNLEVFDIRGIFRRKEVLELTDWYLKMLSLSTAEVNSSPRVCEMVDCAAK